MRTEKKSTAETYLKDIRRKTRRVFTAEQKIKDFEATSGQKFTNNIHVLFRLSLNFHKGFVVSLELLEIEPSFTLGVIEIKRQETLLRLVTNYPIII